MLIKIYYDTGDCILLQHKHNMELSKIYVNVIVQFDDVLSHNYVAWYQKLNMVRRITFRNRTSLLVFGWWVYFRDTDVTENFYKCDKLRNFSCQ